MKQERNCSARKKRTMENIPPNQQALGAAHPNVQCTGWHLDNLSPGPTTDTQLLRLRFWALDAEKQSPGFLSELAACGSKGCK
ncbi:hypothetical protein GWK47_054783 [Chionoecetes opilio]|uniref:Uncharacterized protein n=1 Tax=Chionoecetes opilio TaxID=41210 RepID=A0A8J4Y4Q9_CHIOP|nr:hypothetical protein GWK47_054783 [Chionoecetes opilio]